MDRYLPYNIHKIIEGDQRTAKFMCGECKKTWYRVKNAIEHQRSECQKFLSKNPDIGSFEVKLKRGRPKKSEVKMLVREEGKKREESEEEQEEENQEEEEGKIHEGVRSILERRVKIENQQQQEEQEEEMEDEDARKGKSEEEEEASEAEEDSEQAKKFPQKVPKQSSQSSPHKTSQASSPQQYEVSPAAIDQTPKRQQPPKPQAPCQTITLLIDPTPHKPQSPQFQTRFLTSGQIISSYRNCLFKSFSLLTVGQQKIHLQDFSELLSTYRFERHQGAIQDTDLQRNFEYRERAKITTLELLKLHTNKKQRFMIIMGRNTVLADFYWREDNPEIVLTCDQEELVGEGSPYMELLKVKKSRLFKACSTVCIHSKGPSEIRELWQTIVKLISLNLPFTVISNYPFQNSFKSTPIIRQAPQEVSKKYYQFFNFMSPTKSIYKTKMVGYTTAMCIYGFCMAVMGRGRCLVEVEVEQKAEIVQKIWSTSRLGTD